MKGGGNKRNRDRKRKEILSLVRNRRIIRKIDMKRKEMLSLVSSV